MQPDITQEKAIMKIAALGSPIVFVALLLLTHPASAKRISSQGFSVEEVSKSCGGAGQTYFPPSSKGGAYGCVNADDSGFVCGGTGVDPKTKQPYSSTCDTFRKVPTRLPTRNEMTNLENSKAKD